MKRAPSRGAMAFALTLIAMTVLAPVAHSQSAADMPRHLQDLSKQHRSGDWVLQCDSWVACRILGVVEPGPNPAESRPVVMIDRSWKKDAPFRVQIAFIDGFGQILHANPDATWRVGPGRDDGIAFQFDPNAPAGSPANAVPADAVDAVIDRLSRSGPLALDDGAGRNLRLPRGDLDDLLQRMDGLQRPKGNPLSAAERSVWLKQYRYIVKRVQRADGVASPDSVSLSCDTLKPARHIDGWQLDPERRFWIAHCPEGSRMFLQNADAAPVPFTLSRFGGGLELDVYGAFDPETSLLTIKLSEKKLGDCGHRVRFGWTGAQGFGMIEHRTLIFCRKVPPDLWPMVWTPTQWRYEGESPVSAGDADTPTEAVQAPRSKD